ncbi:phosphoribosyltransferase [Gemmatimonadota bacterium]
MRRDTQRRISTGRESGFSPGKVLYEKKLIGRAVMKMSRGLKKAVGKNELTFLIILKGGARFASDLMSAYDGPYYYEFISASSYGGDLNSRGAVEFQHCNPDRELIDNRHVVLVDDICDSGATFGAVAGRILAEFNPAQLLTCSLIWRDGSGFTPDLWGFHYMGEEFLVGYGLGAGEQYRYLDDIVILEQT